MEYIAKTRISFSQREKVVAGGVVPKLPKAEIERLLASGAIEPAYAEPEVDGADKADKPEDRKKSGKKADKADKPEEFDSGDDNLLPDGINPQLQ